MKCGTEICSLFVPEEKCNELMEAYEKRVYCKGPALLMLGRGLEEIFLKPFFLMALPKIY